MAEIPKKRAISEVDVGMGAPVEGSDQNAIIEQLQQNVEALFRLVGALNIPAAYDDTELKKQIAAEAQRVVAPVFEPTPTDQIWIRFAVVNNTLADYLDCNFYSPVSDSNGAQVNVSKPFHMRQTPWDGETITFDDGQSITYTYSTYRRREADDGVDTEFQVVTPDYADGEIIRIGFGDTGIVVSDVSLVWQDLNTAGRNWARES